MRAKASKVPLLSSVVVLLLALASRCSSFSIPLRQGITSYRSSLWSNSRISSAGTFGLATHRASLYKYQAFRNSSQSRTVSIRATSSVNNTGEESDNNNKSAKKGQQKRTLISLALVALAFGTIQYRHALLKALTSLKPSHLNQILVKRLDQLNDAGTPGLVIYTILFWLWEMTVGITTPVETAAGMAFGVRKGILVNFIGKTGGAMSAFLLGRWVFYDTVHAKVKQNELLGLVEDSITEHPLGVAMLFRLSPMPESVKNLGLSVLELKARYFLLAVILHGLPFSCLWTCLGAETAQVMRGGVASKTLKYLMTGVSWFGLVVSPTLIGLWVKSLKDKQKHLHESDSEENVP